MIMVIITFTVGVHGERYICQTLQENDAGNFTGLQLVQDVLNIPSEVEINAKTIPIDITSIMSECKNNTGLFELLELDKVFNLDELLNMSMYNEALSEQFDS